jgi:cell wall-associated NlpC family hydrolase
MKSFRKIRSVATGLLASCLALSVSCHKAAYRQLQEDVNAISRKWVPDQREGICNVLVERGTGGSVVLKGETLFPGAKEEIMAAARKFNTAVIDSVHLLPDTTQGDMTWGLVTVSVANLRKRPFHESELVSQAILGTPARILKHDGDWLLLQGPDRYVAWTESSSVQSLTDKEMTKWRKADRVIWLGNTGCIYATPGEDQVAGDLVAGCILEKTGEQPAYLAVKLPDGRSGYIRKAEAEDFLKWEQQLPATGRDISRVAGTFIGLPYLWGGTSSKAVDCSGFTKIVYFICGLMLPRDASLQALHGQPVDITEGYGRLQPGDLLFFSSGGGTAGRITHVAVYLGESAYIHASGRVMINSLDSMHADFNRDRFNSLVMARRILGVNGDPGIVMVKGHPWY